jgi:ABC-2 type transport system permease protein
LLGVSIWRELLQTLTWRSFLVSLIINQALTPLIGLILWSVALPGNSQISTYFVALLFVTMMTVSYENYTFGESILNGTIGHQLLIPQPIVVKPLASNLAIRLLFLCVGVPLVVVICWIAHIPFVLMGILLALPALFFAAVLCFLFYYHLALLYLWGSQMGSFFVVGSFLGSLLGGGAFPVYILASGMRTAFSVLPFHAMLGFPAEIMSGSLNGGQIVMGYGWQLVWIGIWSVLVVVTQRNGIRRYVTLGG